MQFPDYRGRRLRKNDHFRRLVRETRLAVDDLVYPLFAVPGKSVKKPIHSMPGQFQLSVDYLAKEVGERAAVPKQVYIVPQIPLTPVGKIFKPALRWESIRKVYAQELSALQGMSEKIEVKVSEDKIHGSLAVITIVPLPGVSEATIRDKVSEVLARYTVRYELNFGK